ncbi:MAG TPA: DegV family protein [Thermomicrobiales bacterium]|nr:DegV family protein [Thermomicrobiales bacterium]
MTETREVLIVTDSTSDIPGSLRDQYDITVVPLNVTFGSDTFQDGVDITPPQYLQRLTQEKDLPKTSQPPSTRFASVFNEAIDRGMDVLCITLSSQLSGTYNSARLAAEEFDSERIRVVDSRSTTMQLGWIVIEAARAVQSGAGLDEAALRATEAIGRANCFAVLQTLDYVYKGGRIGRASHIVGSALGIKPVLNFVDGILTPIERVRTWKKALARAVELAATTGDPQDIAVLHSDNLKDAETTADALRQRLPDASIIIDWTGSTILTYAGPGAIGILTLGKRP